MKNIIIIFLLFPLFTVTAAADSISERAAELSDTHEVYDALSEDEKKISGELKLDGSYDSAAALSRLKENIQKKAGNAVKKELGFAAKLLSAALICAVSASLCTEKRITEYINITGGCTAAYIISGSIDGIVEQALNTLYRLSDYSRAAMPVIFAASAACGAVSSASVKYASACLTMDIFMTAARELILPLIRTYTAVSLSSAIFENPMLKAVSKFCKRSAVLLMSFICIAFSGYIGISGLIAGSTDAMAVKTAKTLISNSLPVVGGIISDAASVMLASASLIKNSAGVFSLVAVCVMCAGPFTVLSVKMLVYKAVSAVSDMLPGGKIPEVLNSMGNTMEMLLGLIGSCGVMLFISVMSGIKAVNI